HLPVHQRRPLDPGGDDLRGRHVGHPGVPDRAHGRVHGPPRPPADARGAARRACARRHHQAAGTADPGVVAGEPPAHGRPHLPHRADDGGDPGGAGVRPGRRGAGAAGADQHALRQRAAPVPLVRAALEHRHRQHHRDRHGGGAVGGVPAGHRRGGHGRVALGLRDLHAGHLPADEPDHVRVRPLPGRGGGRRARLPGPRHRTGHHRAPGRRRARPLPGRHPAGGRVPGARRGPGRPRRGRPGRAPGREGGARRRDRVRQDVGPQPDPPAVRRHRRGGHDRRGRRPGRDAGVAASTGERGVPGAVAVLVLHPRQHPLRAPDRDRRGGRSRRRRRPCEQLRAGAPGRLRHLRRR
ncbi:MAG: hypothetical protein AVDCRST_MAG61-906, partial [uncultured Friedmanniella sp.]